VNSVEGVRIDHRLQSQIRVRCKQYYNIKYTYNLWQPVASMFSRLHRPEVVHVAGTCLVGSPKLELNAYPLYHIEYELINKLE